MEESQIYTFDPGPNKKWYIEGTEQFRGVGGGDIMVHGEGRFQPCRRPRFVSRYWLEIKNGSWPPLPDWIDIWMGL